MKPRHIVLINIIFIGFMLFSAGMVYQFMTGKKPLSIIKSWGYTTKATHVSTNTCSNQKAMNLQGATNASLRKLTVYQEACHGFATDTLMVFLSMPDSEEAAVALAKEDAATLKEFATYHVRPLVIAEPSSKDGTQLDFELFANGTYNTAVARYFAELKAAGVTSQELGIWTPFPEANLPYWDNNQPEFFAPAVNNYLTALRAVFPEAATSVMLNSATYDTSDFNWENGDYASLLPYVKGIQPGLVTYAGLQGFPWMAQQGGGGSILNAAEFLNPDLLTEMATALGTKKVWLNTGTFTSKYTLDPAKVVTMTPERRKSVLATVYDQAIVLQKEGYEVSVNIFAQDKSKTAEETNWSYWGGDKPFSSPAAPVITDFIGRLHDAKINLWLFDR